MEYARKLNKINGTDNMLYWSDISSEICFVIPNGSGSGGGGGSHADTAATPISANPNDDLNRAKHLSVPNDVRVLIVWLEQFQDADQVPIDDLVHEATNIGHQHNDSFGGPPTTHQHTKQKEIIVVFIHPLKNRLNRVALWSSTNRRPFYTMPLQDGMLVGSKMLSAMVRQTVLNIFRRKRLEIDE